jgi:hypothetical protein
LEPWYFHYHAGGPLRTAIGVAANFEKLLVLLLA